MKIGPNCFNPKRGRALGFKLISYSFLFWIIFQGTSITCDTSLCVTSYCFSEKRCGHTECIYMAFLQCVSACESSNDLPASMHSHTGYICATSLRCVQVNVFSGYAYERRQTRTGCTAVHWKGFSPVCFLICLIKSLLSWNPYWHWKHLWNFSLLCTFICLFSSDNVIPL